VFISRDQGIGSAMTSCRVPRRCAWGRRNRGPGTGFENGSGAAGVRAQGGALVRYLASAAMLFNTNLGQLRRAGRGFGADQARTFSVWVCLRWDSSGKLKRPPGRAPRSAATWSRTWIRLRAAIANRSCRQVLHDLLADGEPDAGPGILLRSMQPEHLRAAPSTMLPRCEIPASGPPLRSRH